MIAEVIRIVQDTPTHKFESGIAAKFVYIGDGWGFKFYSDRYECESTYDMQERAAELGIGPKVGDKITFMLNGVQKYGYTTEVAETVKARFSNEYGVPGDVNDYYWDVLHNGEDQEFKREFREAMSEAKDAIEENDEYQYLMSELREHGFDTADMHWGNIGYLPDGRLVCIDFHLC